MKRIKILFGQRRFQVLATLTGVVIAAALVIGSGANFTAHSANPSNVFSTGTLSMSNSPSGMEVTVSNMVPGDSHDGSVVIKNTGDVAGHFYLEPVYLTENTKKIADNLDLTITDEARNVVFDGKLAALPQKDLGQWKADESHTYSFHVSFPDNKRADGIAGAGGIGNDNQYMGATTTAAFNWTTVSVSQGAL
jgi:spore coat-associated protein N